MAIVKSKKKVDETSNSGKFLTSAQASKAILTRVENLMGVQGMRDVLKAPVKTGME